MPQKTCYYAVKVGRQNGVYLTWEECEAQVKGFPGGTFKKFITAAEAESFARGSEPSIASPAATAETISHIQSKKRALSPDAEDGEEEWDVVYCDGSCKGNGQDGSVAGIGVWWGHNDRKNLSERCPGDQTNNRAELIAIARVLETAEIKGIPLVIKTDSQYCIKCFKNWLKGWERNNFKTSKGDPVKNRDLIRYVQALIDYRGKCGQKIRLRHVRGHVGIAGNEGADALANRGTLFPVEAERDWKSLRMDVLHKMEEIPNPDVQQAESNVVDVDPEGQSRKLRKDPMISTSNSLQSHPSYGRKDDTNLTSHPVIIPHIPVNSGDLDIEAYASCLLREEDIWMDLED
ncbi:ribonuclease H-like domain-containing protein [Amanita rubescens]|nr:ribonuclease H-like domain-containing protein [Amanita rubescens]